MIVGPFNSGLATGGAGAAGSNADSTVPLKGYVMGVYVRYNDSPPAGTTDVVVKTKGTNAPSETFLTLTNGATNGWRYPRLLMDDIAGADLTGVYESLLIDDFINVAIAQANDNDSIDVWLMIDES